MAKNNAFNKEMIEAPINNIVNNIQLLGERVASMIWGEPGLGKTETIKYVFSKAGYEVIPVLAGCSEPTDFSGIPFPYGADGKDVAVSMLPPIWAYRCSTIADPRS